MRCLGVGRSPRFSPNSEQRDEAVLLAVANRLRGVGHDVCLVSEDDFDSLAGADVVFCMARDERVLKFLSEAETDGLPVVNSAWALLHDTRAALTRLFANHGIPIPESLCLSPADDVRVGLRYPLWLKRGDACAQSKDDVRFVSSEPELRAALSAFARRDISPAVVCEHVAGDLVKFYGVEDSDFFYYYYPTKGRHFSKFGLEAVNGAPRGYVFDVSALKRCADEAARLSGLPVYGGDCVIRPDGSFSLIDFNDWPSFSLCRDEAAAAIADRVLAAVCSPLPISS